MYNQRLSRKLGILTAAKPSEKYESEPTNEGALNTLPALSIKQAGSMRPIFAGRSGTTTAFPSRNSRPNRNRGVIAKFPDLSIYPQLWTRDGSMTEGFSAKSGVAKPTKNNDRSKRRC